MGQPRRDLTGWNAAGIHRDRPIPEHLRVHREVCGWCGQNTGNGPCEHMGRRLCTGIMGLSRE